MKAFENAFDEFVDAIQAAHDTGAFERVAARLTHRLGFQRFAYLNLAGEEATLISSYPRSWTSRYFDLGYQQLDPVVRRVRLDRQLFSWGGDVSAPCGINREQRRFFDFDPDRHVIEWRDIVQSVGLHFHADVAARLDGSTISQQRAGNELTQREHQCLTWTSQGKTVADIAILVGIARRTVVFHLENARRKLGAASIAQCVAVALRRGLLS
jgi:LuxR family transcriptional activator of conjugal transfer of Ti plasmids